ncbi:MAG: HPr family phosphocarrier protein [Clostridiales bacterium]|nr:HPr family phosphocarrier protein [Clostridiales bacterium]
MIRLGSVRDVEDFVRISTEQPYPVFLDDGNQQVNGKSFMEMFCLTLTKPLRVTLLCGEDQFQDFLSQTTHFQV